jgi:hypothetical protein
MAAQVLALLLSTPTAPAAQQPATSGPAGIQSGSIEFVARVTPTAGRAEPVRQLTFYLLRKSFADIQKETEETEGKPDLDRFIDSLDVSTELKAWMKKKRWIELAGPSFLRQVQVNDILDVPEFYDAYLSRNLGDLDVGFPAPKYRESDRTSNPQKYQKLRQEYREVLRKYIENNPKTLEGMDLHLDAINPIRNWAQQDSELRQHILKRALYLAQTRYLAAKTETDLEGRGSFAGLTPGEYWLGNLDTQAAAGDVRLRWDTPVNVRSREVARLELSNLNAAEPLSSRGTH